MDFFKWVPETETNLNIEQYQLFCLKGNLKLEDNQTGTLIIKSDDIEDIQPEGHIGLTLRISKKHFKNNITQTRILNWNEIPIFITSNQHELPLGRAHKDITYSVKNSLLIKDIRIPLKIPLNIQLGNSTLTNTNDIMQYIKFGILKYAFLSLDVYAHTNADPQPIIIEEFEPVSITFTY